MSAQAGLTPLDMMPVPTRTVEDEFTSGPRSFVSQVLSKTVRRASARFSLTWIGVLGFFAVFAPVIANSNPYLIRMDSHWGSPLLRSLTWADLTLFSAVAASVALWPTRGLSIGRKAMIVLAVIAIVLPLAEVMDVQPANVYYAKYRDAEHAGHVSFVLNAPIPYSASDRFVDQLGMANLAPSRLHLMGTESSGGDVSSRLLHACRVAMSIGLVATCIQIVIGVFVGGLMGYFAGVADILGMRAIEIFEAIPTLFLMITLVAFFPEESYRFYMLMLIIGVTGWTGYARYMRAEFLRLRNQDFVHAAVAVGLPLRSVVFRHILPNGITPVVISASFSVAGAIVAESTLSFLNLGVIDQPSWGGMLTQSLGQGGQFNWWLAVFPGAAIFITVFAYNMLGEALADALDPKRN